MQGLEGKVAFITGGGSSLAPSQAEVFANRLAPPARPTSTMSKPPSA